MDCIIISEHFILKCSLLNIKICCIKSVLENKVPYDLYIYIYKSASERRLVVPSQRGSKSLSRTFSFTVPGRWNDLPTPIRNAGSLSIFKQQLKTHLFQHYLTT